MRVPNAAHESHPWRIREVAPDFELEDAWDLPVRGGADEFPALIRVFTSFDPSGGDSAAARVLWSVRERLGAWFGWDEAPGDLLIPGRADGSLRGKLPPDLSGSADVSGFGSMPFVPVYRTDSEFAAELSNRTVHAVMHLGWLERPGGFHQGRLAVYVKPRGVLGQVYMALIRPFRHAIVYPALLRRIERAWNARGAVQRA
jgi:hypothetical protein